jgi:integrase
MRRPGVRVPLPPPVDQDLKRQHPQVLTPKIVWSPRLNVVPPCRPRGCDFVLYRADEYAIRPAKLKGAWHYRYDFSRAFKSHMKRCGVTCNVHDMRRSFASNLVSEGESVYIVAKWLGDGVQVVERSYGHLSPSAGNINRLAVP